MRCRIVPHESSDCYKSPLSLCKQCPRFYPCRVWRLAGVPEEVSQSMPWFHLHLWNFRLWTVNQQRSYQKQPDVIFYSFQAGQGCLSFWQDLLNIWIADGKWHQFHSRHLRGEEGMLTASLSRHLTALLHTKGLFKGCDNFILTATGWALKRSLNIANDFPSELCTRGHMQPILSWLKIWKWKTFASNSWDSSYSHGGRKKNQDRERSEVLVLDLFRSQVWPCVSLWQVEGVVCGVPVWERIWEHSQIVIARRPLVFVSRSSMGPAIWFNM